MTDTAKASKTVELAEVPVAKLLFAFLSQRFSGRVEFIQPKFEATRTIRLSGGLPIHSDWELPGSRLGEILIEGQTLDEGTVCAALAEQANAKLPLGQLLLARGVPVEVVDGGLIEQCERRLIAMFELRSGTVHIHAEDVDPTGWPQADLLAVIVKGVLEHYDLDRVRLEMGGMVLSHFIASVNLRPYRDRLGLGEVGLAIADAILDSSHGFDIASFVGAGYDEQTTAKVLFALWTTGMVEPPEELELKTDGGRRLDPLSVAGQVEQRIAAKLNPVEILGIVADSGLGDIDFAYQRLCDALKVPEDAAVANQTRERIATVAEHLSQIRDAAVVQREAVLRQVAERALRENRHTKAVKALAELAKQHPNDGAVAADLAWCRLQASGFTSADLERAKAAMDKLLAKHPDAAKAIYYLGHIARARGADKDALRHFDRVVELDPSNLDAQRQARAIRSGQPATRQPQVPAGVPKGYAQPKPRHMFWSGNWPVIWVGSGLLLALMVAAQILLRSNLDF